MRSRLKLELTLLAYRNDLLSVLSDSDAEQIAPHIQRVTLVLEQVVYEAGEPIDQVYFPESGIVSLTADTGDAGLVEVGLVGREGLIGASAILSPNATAIHKALTQVPGSAIRMKTTLFRDMLGRLPAFHDRCLRYVHVLLVQGSQTTACNARHELTERLARWLLMSRDRLDDDELPMTQDFLAFMLGVRRSGVSIVANTLQSSGAIRQARGRITILDRSILEAEACRCYQIIEESRRTIMGET